MTDPTNTTFRTIWQRYSDANARCLTETGDKLSKAQDDEGEAVHRLIATPGRNPDDVAKKLDALKYLLGLGDWADERELKLLDSIRRDLRAMTRRAA